MCNNIIVVVEDGIVCLDGIIIRLHILKSISDIDCNENFGTETWNYLKEEMITKICLIQSLCTAAASNIIYECPTFGKYISYTLKCTQGTFLGK